MFLFCIVLNFAHVFFWHMSLAYEFHSHALSNIITLLIYKKKLILFSVTPNQIERLYSRFTSLDRTDCGTLSREDFLRIPELAINPLCDRIVHAFFADSTDDRVNFRQFMQVLAHFRPIKTNSTNKLNSREEKLKC